jgi:hypothetical protein
MKAEIRMIIAFTGVIVSVIIVATCVYILFNSGQYPTLVNCVAAFILLIGMCAVAPAWRLFLPPPENTSIPRQ